ncbi:MAG: CPXCG motif-containing cysteine-rich protein [Candidatus Korobacteraceae bacterium]
MSGGFQCSYCGEWNVIEVDESAGTSQRYVEDCQTCCQPNVLIVRVESLRQTVTVRAQRES